MPFQCLSEEIAAAPVPMDVTPPQRMMSACAGVLATSLVVTPMDVVKTRVQAAQAEEVRRQVISRSGPGAIEPCLQCIQQCRLYTTSARAPATAPAPGGAALAGFDGTATSAARMALEGGGAASSAGGGRIPTLPTGTVAALTHIARWEGPRGLYRGLDASLVMAIPATVLYYTVYDDFLARLERAGMGNLAAPATAGSTARLLATVVMAPLELVFQEEGAAALWRGVGTTMWRDVPFSMVYWLGYENLKAGLGCGRKVVEGGGTGAGGGAGRGGRVAVELAEDRGSADFLLRSLVAGAVSGVVASLLTHPFDVVKTQRQVVVEGAVDLGCEHRPPPPPRKAPGTFDVMRSIVENKGPAGLFTGALARVGKVAPACAIMMLSYEAGKRFFGERNAAAAAAAAAAAEADAPARGQ
eukprot:g18675.t1